jgi:hypothetical protein
VKDLEFNSEVNASLYRIRDNKGAGIAEEQERLRRLVSLLETEDDRAWAESLIEDLPRRATPLPPSAPMAEALRIQDQAFFSGGTTEERLATLEAARKRIFEIADTAPREEQASIRGLTRTLEHLEEGLRNPYPPFDSPPPGGTA